MEPEPEPEPEPAVPRLKEPEPEPVAPVLHIWEPVPGPPVPVPKPGTRLTGSGGYPAVSGSTKMRTRTGTGPDRFRILGTGTGTGGSVAVPVPKAGDIYGHKNPECGPLKYFMVLVSTRWTHVVLLSTLIVALLALVVRLRAHHPDYLINPLLDNQYHAYQLVTGYKPDLLHLCMFSCAIYVPIAPHQRTKMGR
ncbi:hypothetical protein OSB04_011254 [Centaurea solstitialis]|uniref:Uncharacterized protein n=1 Tax=Centaurea solstitialis TaxID=347529 RepID=A0AA38WLC4_9ASTR|nr:hypothetical protein OSB04_011254 [Centaurea solstitialis]